MARKNVKKDNDMKKSDRDLEGPAKRITELNHTPIRVLAGPGTGKTYALTRRVARILRDGVDPTRILVCTFARTAAKDIQSEIKNLGINGADQVRAETLHAFCFSLLSRNNVLIYIERFLRPLIKFEEKFLAKDLSRMFGGIRSTEKYIKAFNAAWAYRQSEDPGWPHNKTEKEFQRVLDGWLQFHQAMLIGELIPLTLRHLRNNPNSSGHFDHVLVDEYQDLNKAEQVLLDILAENGNLTVIGDEDQSIYSFKYAYPDGIADFDQSHQGTHDEKLDECYRCPHKIVNMANELIDNNPNRTDRFLTPLAKNPEGEVYIYQWDSIKNEAHGIAEIIQERIRKREVETGRILVLASRRQFGYAVRDALKEAGIPAHSFFQEEAFDESEAQKAFTLLTLLVNREDRIALRCWCGFPTPLTGGWARLQEFCKKTGKTPWVALEYIESNKLNISYLEKIVLRFRELKQHIKRLEKIRGKKLADVLFPDGAEWASSIRSLVDSISEDDFGAKELLKVLHDNIIQPELPANVDYVRVMSLHKSKGLTADMVIVVGCTEGLIPTITGDTTTEKSDSLIEQRRLFYVAITRTKNILILSSVRKLKIRDAKQMKVEIHKRDSFHAIAFPSRFLNELGSLQPRSVSGESVIKKMHS